MVAQACLRTFVVLALAGAAHAANIRSHESMMAEITELRAANRALKAQNALLMSNEALVDMLVGQGRMTLATRGGGPFGQGEDKNGEVHLIVPKGCQNKCGCFAPCASGGDTDKLKKKLERLKKQKERVEGQIEITEDHMEAAEKMKEAQDKAGKKVAEKEAKDGEKDKARAEKEAKARAKGQDSPP